jgi:hypothetical protein
MAALKALQMLDLRRGTFIQKQEIGRGRFFGLDL